MEGLLLMALGAWVVSRMGGAPATATPPPAQGQPGSSGAGPQPSQGSGLPVEISRIRLPHVLAGGKEVVALTLPLPAGAVYKWVECKEPGGALRVADIQAKWVDYQNAYNNFVAAGRPRRGKKILKPLEEAKNAYGKAVLLHFSSCSNYAKQL
jgi:hypothetical protein